MLLHREGLMPLSQLRWLTLGQEDPILDYGRGCEWPKGDDSTLSPRGFNTFFFKAQIVI